MEINFKIIYARRRTISLSVERDGSIVVRAPQRVNLKLVSDFVASKQAWIQKRLQTIATHTPKQYQEGELFYFLGKQYPLQFVDAARGLQFENAFNISRLRQDKPKVYMEKWYRSQAEKLFNSRVSFFAGNMNVSYKRIAIRDTGSRWGSCSSLGNLNFCYRLIMAPPEIIDYVIIHELAHLKHRNHSIHFWNFVADYYPSHREARKWLRENGQRLSL